jgi:pimeloyl-ACP methyl ester carboxylesterase
MSFFTFEVKNVFYEEFGSGKPLIFLHGNTVSSKMYGDISRRYIQDFRVILIDFLGHGNSDRLNGFPSDLWYFEAQQVTAFLKYNQYGKVNIIGSSGGALAALNVALEAPELVEKVIADSFEGENADRRFTENLLAERSRALNDAGTRGFYTYMHGDNWESIVENDTSAVIRHANEIVSFFHRPLSELKAELLLTGSRKDSFMYSISDNYYEKVYGDILKKVPNGRMNLFDSGDHPAMLTNADAFYELSMDFLA